MAVDTAHRATVVRVALVPAMEVRVARQVTVAEVEVASVVAGVAATLEVVEVVDTSVAEVEVATPAAEVEAAAGIARKV